MNTLNLRLILGVCDSVFYSVKVDKSAHVLVPVLKYVLFHFFFLKFKQCRILLLLKCYVAVSVYIRST